jgi:hypothetical protein
MLKNIRKTIIRVSLLFLFLWPLGLVLYFASLVIDRNVYFLNKTNKTIYISIRWHDAISRQQIGPFEQYKFRPREDSSFAIYASEKDDHILTCAKDYEFRYNDDYDYKDDPCCSTTSSTCKFAVGIYSSSSSKISYTRSDSELVLEKE